MAPETLIWIVGETLWIIIFVRAIQNRMLGTYSAFYTYAGFLLFIATIRSTVIFTLGIRSVEYWYAYYIPTYLMSWVQLWVLWDVHRRIVTNQDIGNTEHSWKLLFRPVMIVAVLTAPIALTVLLQTTGGVFLKYQAIALFVQVSFCLLINREAVKARYRVDLGRNLKGILLGISILVGTQSLNFIIFVFGESSFQIFRFLLQFLFFVALICFAYSLWDYEPLRIADASYERRLRAVNQKMHQALKSILTNRR